MRQGREWSSEGQGSEGGRGQEPKDHMVLCCPACHFPGCHPWLRIHSFIHSFIYSFIHSYMPACYRGQVRVLGELKI